MMIRWMRMGASAVLTVVLVLGMVVVSAPAALAEFAQTSYVTNDGKYEVKWSGNWSLDKESSGESQMGTTVTLWSDLHFYSVLIFNESFGSQTQAAFANYREGFLKSVGTNLSDVRPWHENDSYYSMDEFVMEGVRITALMRMDEGDIGDRSIIQMLVVPSDEFEKAFKKVQTNIQLNSDPGFAGNSLDSLANEGEGDEKAGSDRSKPATSADDSDYVNDEHGFAINYDSPWRLSSANSDSLLALTDNVFSSVRIDVMDSHGMEPQEFIAAMSSSFRRSDMVGTGPVTNTIASDDRVLIVYGPTTPGAAFQELIFLGDESVVVVTVQVMNNVDDIVKSLQDNVEINGEPLARDWGQ